MNVLVRQEKEVDYKITEDVVEQAFEHAVPSDHNEHFLVERLRKSDAFIPELSLVAEVNGEIVGHIMLTKAHIKNEENAFHTLALAPLSVLPSYQSKGIGSILTTESFKRAKELGYTSVIVLGHPTYYPRFGFERASTWGIKPPFNVPEAVFMALELQEGSLTGVSGTFMYAKEFFE